MQWPSNMPKWIAEGLKFVGLKEIPGKQNNSTIVNWVRALKGWWAEDETPWCGTFVGHCIEAAGLTPPKNWFRAKSWSDYGLKISKEGTIPFGSICVKSRVGGGHVFFAVARSADGRTIFGLGGNQGNMVSIVPFSLEEIDTVIWPDMSAVRVPLPVSTKAELGAVGKGSEA